MTDRELLELAAKAYGVILNQYETEDFLRADHSMQGRFWNPRWNPLTDDGDALRLAVKCKLTVCTDGELTVSVHEAYKNNKIGRAHV